MVARLLYSLVVEHDNSMTAAILRRARTTPATLQRT
jgi:hypothetical protein